jgi:hypothetical protein
MIVYTLPFSEAATELHLRGRMFPLLLSQCLRNTDQSWRYRWRDNRRPISREGVRQVAEFRCLGKTTPPLHQSEKQRCNPKIKKTGRDLPTTDLLNELGTDIRH